MKRAPSYSDSFLVLNGGSSIDLQPLVTPREILKPEPSARRPCSVLCFVFTFKGSFHLLLISAFETAFYFLIVNKSEDAGILGTINTYYQPLVNHCQQTWGNGTRWFIQQLLKYELNQTLIDQLGDQARTQRESYNQHLLIMSSLYSAVWFAICLIVSGLVWWKGWPVPWVRMLTEHLLFVTLLGLYEFFFFRTIIYNYDTLSTKELNQYIVDGLAQCASS